MKTLYRKPVNKSASSKQFAHKVNTTKAANQMPRRGGFRL